MCMYLINCNMTFIHWHPFDLLHNCVNLYALIFLVVPVRLSDGDSSRSGRIEMYINGQWGTVCDDGWNTGSGSTIVCRQLGLGSTGTTHRYAAGPLSFPILLDEVRCNGNEANILACPHLRLNEHNCNHDEDVGVICSGLYS